MPKLKLTDVITQYVEDNIGVFHDNRVRSLDELKLKKVLKSKNPYLFKAKNMLTAEQIIKSLTDAHISSDEETIFGDWLEKLAIFINEKVYNGRKSGISGIDLEFDKNGTRYIVSIKSGPNWANGSQLKKLKLDFISAKKTLRTSNSQLNVVAVNGCCYGKNKKTDKGEYFKYCGQEFWTFISDEPTLYTDLIIPIGYKAKEQNDIFVVSYSKMLNRFTSEFINDFCNTDGSINWDKLVKFNSGKS